MGLKKYITDSEIDGEVKIQLLEKVNRFIRLIRSVFSIHCFTKGQHSDNSFHYKGMAGDGHAVKFAPERRPTEADAKQVLLSIQELIERPKKSIFEQALLAYLGGINGVGMYPHWTPGPGLHMDIRKDKLAWIGLNKEKLQEMIDKEDGEQVYIYLI